jgi:hypothetical protein
MHSTSHPRKNILPKGSRSSTSKTQELNLKCGGASLFDLMIFGEQAQNLALNCFNETSRKFEQSLIS